MSPILSVLGLSCQVGSGIYQLDPKEQVSSKYTNLGGIDM